jgi:hypothetical protein
MSIWFPGVSAFRELDANMKAPRYVEKPIIYQPAVCSDMPEGTNLNQGSQGTY